MYIALFDPVYDETEEVCKSIFKVIVKNILEFLSTK